MRRHQDLRRRSQTPSADARARGDRLPHGNSKSSSWAQTATSWVSKVRGEQEFEASSNTGTCLAGRAPAWINITLSTTPPPDSLCWRSRCRTPAGTCMRMCGAGGGGVNSDSQNAANRSDRSPRPWTTPCAVDGTMGASVRAVLQCCRIGCGLEKQEVARVV